MKRALIVQPSLQPPGGGNGVAAWMTQALRDTHQVSLLTWAELDLGAVDRHFGTTLASERVLWLQPPAHWREPVNALSRGADLLKSSLLLRYAKRIAHGFDVVLTANNEADLGRRGLQYVHYPRYLRPRPAVDLKWFHLNALLAGYYRLCDALADFSFERMKTNVTCANSDWTARLFERVHGVKALTLPPPAAAPQGSRPWHDRQDAFLCLGRIAPEKEIERVIAIIERVRSSVPGARLCIVGGHGPREYESRIAAQVAARSDWASLRVNVSRAELSGLLASYRYGLHAMREEHFGMAPAEMIAAGMIVFLPAGGGQVEIVDGDSRFLYESDADAATRILAVMNDAEQQQRLLSALAPRRDAFSPERFMARIRELVDGLAENGARH